MGKILATVLAGTALSGALTVAVPVGVSDAAARITNVNDRCFTARNDATDPERSLTVRRDGTKLHVGFYRTQQDIQLGVVRYQMYVVHDNNRAKAGDSRLPWHGRCTNSPDKYSYSYKPTSWAACNTPCNTWAFTPTFDQIRDEANAFVLIGLNAAGERVVARYRAFFERQTGTIWGKINYAACKVSAVGLPTATSYFLFSRAALNSIGVFGGPKGKALSDSGRLLVDGVALAMNVDPRTGQVEHTYTLTVERAKYDAKVIAKLAKEWAAERGGTGTTTTTKVVAGKVSVVVKYYATVTSSRAFVQSLQNWKGDRNSNDAVCAVWRGG